MQFGTASPLNSCQRAIGSAPTQFVESKSKALQKCWDARLKGLHSNSCPTPGDGIAAGRIQRAQVKAMGAICRRCGGSDLACDGAGDFTPAQIGFVGTCPSVTVPGGSSCGGPINSLQDLVACVDCVSEFKVDCADALTVPGFESYPTQCNVQVGTTSTTISSTTTTTIPSCPPPAAAVG